MKVSVYYDLHEHTVHDPQNENSGLEKLLGDRKHWLLLYDYQGSMNTGVGGEKIREISKLCSKTLLHIVQNPISCDYIQILIS